MRIPVPRVLDMLVMIGNDLILEAHILMPSPKRASLTSPQRPHVGRRPRSRYVPSTLTWITTLLAIQSGPPLTPVSRALPKNER